MAKPTGFLEYPRKGTPYRPVEERVKDYALAQTDMPVDDLKVQAARCMDCGIPFCNNGCPLGNIIPDWNDLAYRDKWEDALLRLHSTNNFPEFTGSRLSRTLRSRLRAGDQPGSRDHQGGRVGDHPARLRRGLGASRAPRSAGAGAASRWSARAPRAWRPPSS